MKLWIRKFSVVLIAIMTLGLYIPTTDITSEAEESKEISPTNPVVDTTLETLSNKALSTDLEQEHINKVFSYEAELRTQAKDQLEMKLGPRIISQVEDEFTEVILPTIENVLDTLFMNLKEEELSYYRITEHPSPGYAEKIFNVYDERNSRSIAKFHVRRELRPLDGYWFNFHYHLSNDDFREHHEIGEIYWDKNTPPKWMA